MVINFKFTVSLNLLNINKEPKNQLIINSIKENTDFKDDLNKVKFMKIVEENLQNSFETLFNKVKKMKLSKGILF